jgi:hypothetical protein
MARACPERLVSAPIVTRRDVESSDDNARAVLGFRAAYVFDVLSRDSATRSRQRRRGRRGRRLYSPN